MAPQEPNNWREPDEQQEPEGDPEGEGRELEEAGDMFPADLNDFETLTVFDALFGDE